MHQVGVTGIEDEVEEEEEEGAMEKKHRGECMTRYWIIYSGQAVLLELHTGLRVLYVVQMRETINSRSIFAEGTSWKVTHGRGLD
jgi:hypothetical protein